MSRWKKKTKKMSYSNFGAKNISCKAALKSHAIIFLIDRTLEVDK